MGRPFEFSNISVFWHGFTMVNRPRYSLVPMLCVGTRFTFGLCWKTFFEAIILAINR